MMCRIINTVRRFLSVFPSYHEISRAFRHYQLLINVIQRLRLFSLSITRTTSCPPAHQSHSWSVFHQIHFHHYIYFISVPPLHFHHVDNILQLINTTVSLFSTNVNTFLFHTKIVIFCIYTFFLFFSSLNYDVPTINYDSFFGIH